jgi:hypothetical protein
MMKTTLAGRFLAMTIMAGLLMASFAIAQKTDQPEVLMEAVHPQQVEGARTAAARTHLLHQHSGSLSGRHATFRWSLRHTVRFGFWRRFKQSISRTLAGSPFLKRVVVVVPADLCKRGL